MNSLAVVVYVVNSFIGLVIIYFMYRAYVYYRNAPKEADGNTLTSNAKSTFINEYFIPLAASIFGVAIIQAIIWYGYFNATNSRNANRMKFTL